MIWTVKTTFCIISSTSIQPWYAVSCCLKPFGRQSTINEQNTKGLVCVKFEYVSIIRKYMSIQVLMLQMILLLGSIIFTSHIITQFQTSRTESTTLIEWYDCRIWWNIIMHCTWSLLIFVFIFWISFVLFLHVCHRGSRTISPRTISPRTISPGQYPPHDKTPPDKIPPFQYPHGQYPPGQYPPRWYL